MFSLSKRVSLCTSELFEFLDLFTIKGLINHGSLSVCLSVHQQFGIFVMNGLLVFSDFLYRGRQLEYSKTLRTLYSRKILFPPNLGKNCSTWLQNMLFFYFRKTFAISFPGNNLKWKLLLLLTCHYQSNVWQVMGRVDIIILGVCSQICQKYPK